MKTRDLFYPLEWTFRFFIAALLVRIITPYWCDGPICWVTYCALTVAGAGTLVIQVWLTVKFYTSSREMYQLSYFQGLQILHLFMKT